MKKLKIQYSGYDGTYYPKEKDFTGRWKVVKHNDGCYDLFAEVRLSKFLGFKSKTWIDSDYISFSDYEEFING